MTISRFDIARAMVADVVAEWTDMPGELQTITGYSWDEYRTLAAKIDDPSYRISTDDDHMLRQAAHQFFGYPNMTTTNIESSVGPNWSSVLKSAFLENNQ